jgi:hypothetical protein
MTNDYCSNCNSDIVQTADLCGVCVQKEFEKSDTEIATLKAKVAEVEGANLELFKANQQLKASKLDADANAQEWEAENKELKAVIKMLAEKLVMNSIKYRYCRGSGTIERTIESVIQLAAHKVRRKA